MKCTPKIEDRMHANRATRPDPLSSSNCGYPLHLSIARIDWTHVNRLPSIASGLIGMLENSESSKSLCLLCITPELVTRPK